ncbi:hypothetical protein A2U01_0056305, partial [Trifolium medium]|nr:hypothetical protein [Trifolium medium]
DNPFDLIEKRARQTAPIVEDLADKIPVIEISSDSNEEEDDDDDEDDESEDEDDDDDHDEDEDPGPFGMVYNVEDVVEDDEDRLRYNHFDVEITESMAYSNQVMVSVISN